LTSPSAAFTPTAAGSYRYIATYSGDANYTSVSGACNDPNESAVMTAPAVATIVTTASSATIGSAITDTATVSGSGPVPTGTVTFNAFGPNDATCAGPSAFTATTPLAGGPPPTANSGPFTPTIPGTYRWVAAYSGDANYTGVTGACNDPNETSVVSPPGAVTVSTNASPGGTVGTPVTDTATVSRPSPSAPQPTGTNYAAVAGVCNEAGEAVTVVPATPTLTTQASPSVVWGGNIWDTATINGNNPTGTLT